MSSQNIQVIVVPENNEFKHDVSHDLVVYTNKNIGKPQIVERNAKYLVPYWLDKHYADRIYEIRPFQVYEEETCFVINLGNSFLLEKKWNNMGNKLHYEYWSLSEFGMKEVSNGILVPNDFDIKTFVKQLIDKY